MRRAAVKKYHPRQIIGQARSPRNGPRSAQLGTMIDTLAYVKTQENVHIWAFLALSAPAILHAILHGEPTQEAEKGRPRGPERWAYTILRKVLYYTKYLQVEAYAPDHPARPRPEPGI